MKLFIRLAILASAAILPAACISERNPGAREEFRELIGQSNDCMQQQDIDGAMEKAIGALELADANHMEECIAEAMNSIAAIDLATSRDDHAWEYASKAEALCREQGFSRDLAKALLIKARICIYASISPDNNRDDEALPYLEEALKITQAIGDIPLQIDAYYSYSQVYVNKNRWNSVLDAGLYGLAEKNLSEGEALASSNGLSDLTVKGMLFRMRLFRQAARYEEAIEYCNEVLKASKEDDYLLLYQVYDQLTPIYYLLEDHDKVIDCHTRTVEYLQRYINQKADDKLQEMETKYEAALKEQTIKKNKYLISSLLMALILLVGAVVFLLHLRSSVKARNAELEDKGKAKDEVISFLADDLDIKELEDNKEPMADAVADYVGSVIARKDKKAKDLGLTKRELEIIRLSAEGKSASEIASQLSISPRTVDNHKYNIFSKLGVSSTSEMTAKARKHKII